MKELVDTQQFIQNQSLAPYTTIGLGPEAEYLLKVVSIDQAVNVMRMIAQRQLPYIVLGRGSNVLLQGSYFKGIALINKINFLNKEGSLIKVGAGYSFSHLGKSLVKLGDERWYFAAGIPGSVGGAVMMNAGSLGFELVQFLEEVEVILPGGTRKSYKVDFREWGYRKSPEYLKKGMVVSATINLKKNTHAMVNGYEKYMRKIANQPYHQKSAGCLFRNPEGMSAGQLIDQLGLKGMSCGAAVVSRDHANFLVNQSEATYEQFNCLINYIKNQALEIRGICLEEEVVHVHTG